MVSGEFTEWQQTLNKGQALNEDDDDDDDDFFSEDEDEAEIQANVVQQEEHHQFMNISRPPQAASAMLFYMSYYAIIYHPWITDRVAMSESFSDDNRTGISASLDSAAVHVACSIGFCHVWGPSLVECPKCEGHLFCNKPVLDPSTGTYIKHSDHNIHIPRLVKMHEERATSTNIKVKPYGVCEDTKITNTSLRCTKGALFGWKFCDDHLNIRKKRGHDLGSVPTRVDDTYTKDISRAGPYDNKYDSFFGVSHTEDRVEFPSFHHLYCFLKKQSPGTDCLPLPVGYAKRLAIYGADHYDMPPSLNVGLFQASPLVDSWFSLPHNVLGVVKSLSDIQSKYNTPSKQKFKKMTKMEQKLSTYCREFLEDPQMSNWTLLHAILERTRVSPILRVDLKSENIMENADDNPEGLVDLGQCFTRVPDHCPIAPQMGDDALCCIRFGDDYVDKDKRFPLGSFIFISQKYGKYIEAYWACCMIDKMVACKVFNWCSTETIAMGESMDIDKALTKCYKLLVPQFVDYWTKHLIRLNTFFQFVTKTKDNTWNVIYSSPK